MSFFSRFFFFLKDQNLPTLAELLQARGIPTEMPGLNDDFLRDFSLLKAKERESTADAIAALFRQGLPLPLPWREAQYELFPQIVPTWQGEREPYYYRPCFDNLCKRILSAGKPVPQEWFAIWDIPEDDVMDLAMDHLEEVTKDKPFVRLPSGIYRSDFGDGLDASRILLPNYWNQLFPGQNTFVAIPKPDTLLVSPQVLLPKLADAIGAAIKNTDTNILVVTMYQWVDSKLMPASLQDPHPMIQPQREFRQLDTMAAYNAQVAELEKMQIGVPCPLGIIKTQQGRTLTMATWIEGKPALVPDSDLIGFISSAGRPLGLYWRQTLPRLQRLKGTIVEIWGARRLRFEEFPSLDELEQLECLAHADVHAQIVNPQTAQQSRPAPNKLQSQQSHAASATASSNSPVPAHLRGLSLGVQSDDD
ncbi:MAG: hypothetical protein LBH03_00630 [Holophagales bacterium]|jgi:hypothetical protein|nr:hypothetical protein [Holophagales bacterium]